MISLCVELKTKCKHCETPLMLNAFTEDILCSSCNKTNSFHSDEWHGILDDAFKEVPKFKLGEGQPSQLFRGEYQYGLMYGSQLPRCGKCKENVDISKLEEYTAKNTITCSKCSNLIYIRKPSEFVIKAFSNVKYLIGEDDDLLSENKSSEELPNSTKPVIYTCPSCAGALHIDGSNRMVTCKFCNSEIYLPDDLWFRLHPAKTVSRWYILYEGSPSGSLKADGTPVTSGIPEWYYLSDVTIDKQGNLYVASKDDENDGFIVWSIDKELKVRWIRKGLKYNHEHTGITVTNDGHLFLWDKDKHSLLKISSKNGEDINKIKGADGEEFDMKGCTSLISANDGTVLCLINNIIARFSETKKRVELWSGGLFGGVGKDLPKNDEDWAPYLKDVGSRPKRINSDFTRLNMGWDGYLYVIDRSSQDGEVAKYDSNSGKQIWSYYIPLKYKDCKACTDGKGNVYVIGMNDKSNTNLIRFNNGNKKAEILLKDIKEGGVLNQEDNLAVAPDGTIYAMKFYNRMKVFTPDLKMVYRSEQSKKEDEEVLKRKKEKIENDEDFE